MRISDWSSDVCSSDLLGLLSECDLVIEAIAERMDWKTGLYEKLAPAIKHDAIIASNTSGLSITQLSQALPPALRHRFCGVHFFNPPRYMTLVELIPTADTEPRLLDLLETFLVSQLGKGVVRAKDTPNFVGNRIGVFGILSVFTQAEKFGLSYELVDELTGSRLRSEEHTSELQSLMRISYAVFCLKKKKMIYDKPLCIVDVNSRML